MQVSDFDYELDPSFIAQEPLPNRSDSKLLVLNKKTGEITHDRFYNIGKYLRAGDLLILNNTKVIPARLYGVKEGTGGAIEFLLLKRIDKDTWEVILKPGKKARPGARFVFGDGKLIAEVLSVLEGGNRLVRFIYDGVFEEVLDELGEVPLPHYITQELKDRERYQTVYAKNDGSAAAPTAGLHFTEELLASLKEQGVRVEFVTLHVGLGTFRPVKAETVEDHVMHTEYYEFPKEAADAVSETKKNGGRVICVGTTSLRTLESAAQQGIYPQNGETGIFIYPGYEFKAADCLITNFHLPKSTLMMLVSALAGRDHIMAAYEEAKANAYRFFSFGDAMFIQ